MDHKHIKSASKARLLISGLVAAVLVPLGAISAQAAPSVPGSLSCNNGNNSSNPSDYEKGNLLWGAATGAVRYSVKFGDEEYKTTTTGVSNVDILPGAVYPMTVTAYDSAGASSTSAVFTCNTFLPWANVTAVSMVTDTAGGARVKWAPSQYTNKYEVYRWANQWSFTTGNQGFTGSPTLIATVSNSLSYIDRSATGLGTQYVYKILPVADGNPRRVAVIGSVTGTAGNLAWNSLGNSTKFSAQMLNDAGGGKDVKLTWAASQALYRVSVYRKDVTLGTETLLSTPTATPGQAFPSILTDPNPICGHTYEYSGLGQS